MTQSKAGGISAPGGLGGGIEGSWRSRDRGSCGGTGLTQSPGTGRAGWISPAQHLRASAPAVFPHASRRALAGCALLCCTFSHLAHAVASEPLWVPWEGAEVLVGQRGASQDSHGGYSWGCTTSPAASPPAARLGCARGALLHIRERFWVMERPGQGLCWGSGGPGSWVLLVPWMLTTSTSTGEVCGHRTAHARPLLGCPATG